MSTLPDNEPPIGQGHDQAELFEIVHGLGGIPVLKTTEEISPREILDTRLRAIDTLVLKDFETTYTTADEKHAFDGVPQTFKRRMLARRTLPVISSHAFGLLRDDSGAKRDLIPGVAVKRVMGSYYGHMERGEPMPPEDQERCRLFALERAYHFPEIHIVRRLYDTLRKKGESAEGFQSKTLDDLLIIYGDTLQRINEQLRRRVIKRATDRPSGM